jgi:hypothetical protein
MAERVQVERIGRKGTSRKKWQKGFKLKEMAERVPVERNGRKG